MSPPPEKKNKTLTYPQQLYFLQQQTNYMLNEVPPPCSHNHHFLTVNNVSPPLFNRQFAYDGGSSSSGGPFGLQLAEVREMMSVQEIMDAKALAASRSHSEAERRRRERINNHLSKLRTLLPHTTKMDKASLLAEVIQQLKELKRQASIIAETSPVPTETDELTLDNTTTISKEEYGNNKFVIKASVCCEDRNDLLSDLINTLKTLRLRTFKAEITTLGGRVKNVLFIGQENNNDGDSPPAMSYIQDALKEVMEKSSGDHDQSSMLSGSTVKRQRLRTNVI